MKTLIFLAEMPVFTRVSPLRWPVADVAVVVHFLVIFGQIGNLLPKQTTICIALFVYFDNAKSLQNALHLTLTKKSIAIVLCALELCVCDNLHLAIILHCPRPARPRIRQVERSVTSLSICQQTAVTFDFSTLSFVNCFSFVFHCCYHCCYRTIEPFTICLKVRNPYEKCRQSSNRFSLIMITSL